jgi:hypothetical protein
LKTAVFATKTKRIRNLPGYYNGVLKNLLDDLYYKELENMHSEVLETEDIETSEIYADNQTQLAIWRSYELIFD